MVNHILELTEELYAAKRFTTILSFANSVFSLYILIQTFLAHIWVLVVVAAFVFFFNCLLFVFASKSWRVQGTVGSKRRWFQ